MLKIFFGDMPDAIYNPSVYFDNTYDEAWLTDDFAIKAIKRIDKSEVFNAQTVKSPVLGAIPPERLSGGVKTLILIKNVPDMVFNASACGDNCAGLLLELGRKQDITVNMRHLMDFGKRKFKIQVLNTGEIVESMINLMMIAYDYV